MYARKRERLVGFIPLLFAVQVVLMLSGCQSEHKTATTGTDAVCPACQAELRVAPITDLTYTICICPKCQKVLALEASTRETREAYLGESIGDTVHICDACETIVERCAVCREK